MSSKSSTLVAATAPQSAGYAAVLAGLVSYGVAEWMLIFVEQVELLLVFTALGACLMVGARRAYEEWALRDRRIDRFEAFVLDFFSLFKLILFFCAGQYVIRIVKNWFLLGGLKLPNVLLMIGVLVMLALAFVPFVTSTILFLPLSRVDTIMDSSSSSSSPSPSSSSTPTPVTPPTLSSKNNIANLVATVESETEKVNVLLHRLTI